MWYPTAMDRFPVEKCAFPHARRCNECIGIQIMHACSVFGMSRTRLFFIICRLWAPWWFPHVCRQDSCPQAIELFKHILSKYHTFVCHECGHVTKPSMLIIAFRLISVMFAKEVSLLLWVFHPHCSWLEFFSGNAVHYTRHVLVR